MRKTAKNSIIYMGGMIAIAFVSFLSTIILTRILPNQVYAQQGLFVTFMTAVVTVVSLGMDASYTRFFYENNLTPWRFLLKTILLPIVVLGLVVLLLLEPSHFVLQYLFEEPVGHSFALIITLSLCFSLFGKFTQLTARMGEFAFNYVLSNFIHKAGFVIIIFGIYAYCTNVDLTLVVISFLLASILSVIINIYTLFKARSIQKAKSHSVSTNEMLKYGVPFMFSNVMVLIIPLIERVLVRDLAGWDVLSLYTAAAVFYTVIALMKNTIDNVWNPIVYQHYNNESLFKPLLHDFGLFASLFTTVILALCILFRRWLVMILDSSYNEVFIIAPAIMYTACYSIITVIYSVGINTSKKSQHMFVAPIIQVIVSVTLCYLLIPQYGLVGIGLAHLVSVLANNSYRMIIGLRLYDTDINEWKTMALCCVSIVASVFVMFSHTLMSDICTAISIILISLLIVNKEGRRITDKMITLLKPQNKL